MKETENKMTHTADIIESFNGEKVLKESLHAKYLGQKICSNGTNVQNVKNYSNKGRGLGNKIENTLKNTPGGKYHFELAVIMRNAILISSKLSCSEVWYSVTKVSTEY